MHRPLCPLALVVEPVARRDQRLGGPVADLGQEDTGGRGVGEVDADGLAGRSEDPESDEGAGELPSAIGFEESEGADGDDGAPV